jgi:di/tricarboxylate transporter
MPTDAWITLAVLVVTFVLLAFDRMPVPAGLAAAVGTLLLIGVVDQDQALTGLASSAPVTIAALYVIAGAATVTGAVSPLIDRVLGAGAGNGSDRADRPRLFRLCAMAAGMSAVLPNTPLVALSAPRVVTWARRNGRPASRYLMPLSFAAVLGGVITVIGTSTNLVVSDLLRATGDDPLGVFEITAVGLPVALVGLVVLVVLAPVLLPDRRPITDTTSPTAGNASRYTVAVRVQADGPLVGRRVEEAGLRHLHGVFLAGIEVDGTIRPASPDTLLAGHETLYFVGDVTDVLDLDEIDGLASAERVHAIDAGDRPDSQLYEVVVSEGSDLVGNTLRNAGFRARYGAAVLAIRRHHDEVPGKLGTLPLRAGDVLLVLGSPEFARHGGASSDFSVVASRSEPPPVRRRGAGIVLVAIVAMVALAVGGVFTLMESALAAAVALVVTRVLSPAEARRSVNLNVVLTIAVSISLGTAVAASGLADEIARLLGAVGDPFGTWGQVLAVLLATIVLTELLSNTAAAALMFPVAVQTALAADLDPRSMAVVVLIGASCSFLSPIGYQTNLMVHSLGGYRFTDFARLGAPLTLSTIVVTTAVVPLVLPLR